MMKKYFKTFLVMMIVVCSPNFFAQSTSSRRIINLNFNQVKGPLNTMFKECVGAGRAYEGLRADWQQQLAYLKKECGFKYIRMHGLLTDDMGRPNQLTKAQVKKIKSLNDGSPVYSEKIKVKTDETFMK